MPVTVAQLGARMHYAVPRILHAAGKLDRLYTDICATKGWPALLRLVPPGLQPAGMRRLAGRDPGIPGNRVTAFTAFGMSYALRLSRARSDLERTAEHLRAGNRFNELVIRHGFGGAKWVYGFNSASERLFEAAQGRGVGRILEQTIVPKASEIDLLARAPAASSRWSPAPGPDAQERNFIARERREWALADMIICPSVFVRDAVVAEGGDSAKCVVVPYGVDPADDVPGEARRHDGHSELRVLFVGSVGLRKGVPYLLDAMRQLAGMDIRCRVVGSATVEPDFIRSQAPPNVEWPGAIPRSEIAGQYAWADVFCLPSLCEGSATVVYEALAAGLPVITTPNSGSIVRDGVEGIIAPAAEAGSLAAAIERLHRDRSLLAKMAAAARHRSSYGSVSGYSQRLLDALSTLPV